MSIPIWAFAGLIASGMAATMMLVQEKQKAEGFALAAWNKMTICLLLIIPALYIGFPHNPEFYLYTAATAIIYAISDVIFFNLVSRSGAGVVSRILPLNVIFIFVAWLPFDPDLVSHYLSNPWQTTGIVMALTGAAFSAAVLKKCEFSWDAIKYGWFIIVAGVAGSVLLKKAMVGIDPMQAAISFVPIQAAMMVACWAIYYTVRRPIPAKTLFSKESIKAGGIIGCITTIMVTANVYGIAVAENPAYMSALFHLSSVFVILYYRLIKHKEVANVKAGMGVVFCAVALILLKSI
ncbi:MAG TPA: hypothetical protein DHW10_05550 [Rhodospirillaceae bacterium]|nr:hypothetical protein [Rhodospirillaceae bacterium]